MSLGGRWVDHALALAAIVLVVVVFATRESVTTSEVRSRENNVIEVWRPDAVSRLILQQGEQRVELIRKTDPKGGERRWYLAGEANQLADAEVVDELLGSLHFAAWLRKLDTRDSAPEKLGFDNPRAELDLEMGSVAFHVRLGKERKGSPQSAYLEVRGGADPTPTTGIVKTEVADALLVDQRAFFGRSMIGIAPSELSRLQLSGSGGERRLVRRAHRWRFDGMMNDRLVDDEALDPLLFQFARIRAESFLDASQAKDALTGEHVRLELESRNKKQSVTMEVGGKCPHQEGMVVAWRRNPDPLAGCVTGQVLAGLTLSAQSLLDRTAFGFARESVEELRIERNDQVLSLKRQDDGFVLAAPEKGVVSLEAGNRRLQELVSTRGELLESPDLHALGLEPARGRVTVRGLEKMGTSAVDETILLGNVDTDGRLAVKRELDQQVLRFEPGAARAFAVDATLLKSTDILDFDVQRLQSLVIETRDYQQSLERHSGDWLLVKPKGFEADARLANELASALASLTAQRWVSDQDDGSFGLSKPRLRIELKLAESEKPRQLTVGDPVIGGAYAKLGDRDGVFVLPTEALRALDRLVVTRSGFVFHEDALAELQITTRDRELRLTRRGDQWTSDALMGSEQASLIMEAALALRPDVAVHTGPEKPSEGFARPVCSLEFTLNRDGQEQHTTVRLGASDVWHNASIHYARSSATDATFVIERSRLQQLLDLL